MAKHLKRKTVNLALQGGGAHGAYTWGALDRLLEEDRLDIEGISGTSAGAMNALMLKTGFVNGGTKGAKALLDQFWEEIRAQAKRSVNPLTDWVALFSNDVARIADAAIRSPVYFASDTLGRAFSPYDWNPLNINPLRELLDDLICWKTVCKECLPSLFISATNVRSGKIKVFRDSEMSLDVVLASACLPNLFQAVEINKQHYWDGGFMGNPALYPLFRRCSSPDTIIVHVNPIERPDVPTKADDIQNRINEISFNSSLLRELRSLTRIMELIKSGELVSTTERALYIHSIRDDETMAKLNVATKIVPEPELFDFLRDAGRKSADTFLTNHWGDIGKKSSMDLPTMFED
ncbi:MAG: patatin-like phospholipase family protein [Pseudomonadota bacterium]